jgi:hypothetical protein
MRRLKQFSLVWKCLMSFATPAGANNSVFPEISMPRLSPRPVAEAGIQSPLISLGGTWKFNPAPPVDFQKIGAAQTREWKKIQVPGEWGMQGFEVKTNAAAGYWREFEIPAEWRGQRVKLRFDIVHSDGRVFLISGRTGLLVAAYHSGGGGGFLRRILRRNVGRWSRDPGWWMKLHCNFRMNRRSMFMPCPNKFGCFKIN